MAYVTPLIGPKPGLASMSCSYPGTKRHYHLRAEFRLAQWDLKVIGVHAASPYTVYRDSDHFEVAGLEKVRQHVNRALPTLPVGLEVEAEIVVAPWLFQHVGTGIDMGQVIQLEGVVTSRMALLVSVVPLD